MKVPLSCSVSREYISLVKFGRHNCLWCKTIEARGDRVRGMLVALHVFRNLKPWSVTAVESGGKNGVQEDTLHRTHSKK